MVADVANADMEARLPSERSHALCTHARLSPRRRTLDTRSGGTRMFGSP